MRKGIHTFIFKGNRIEIIIFVSLTVIATIVFCFGYDLWHTSNCSLAYLQGHFSDFYDYNFYTRDTKTIVYFPTIYILFAVWNIPLHLMGITDLTYNSVGALLWGKGLGLVFLIICYWTVYHIVLKLTNQNEIKAKNSLVVMALGIPVLFLFEFSWGLYDTVWLAFCLLGILNLMKNRKKNFVLAIVFFALAVSLKMFVLFIIVPILCYKVKNIVFLFISGIGTLTLWLIELFLYRNSDYFISEVVNPLNGGFLNNSVWGASINHISVLLTVFLVVSIYAYTKNDNDIWGYVYVPFFMGILFVCISQQTPNWHVIYMPFMAILVSLLNKNERKVCYLCSSVLSAGVITFIMTTRGYWFGETSIGSGVFGKLLFGVANPVDECLVRSNSFYTAKLFGESRIVDNMVLNYADTIIFAVALFLCIFIYKNLFKDDFIKEKIEENLIIDKKERLGMYVLMIVVCCTMYYIPVLAWTISAMPF